MWRGWRGTRHQGEGIWRGVLLDIGTVMECRDQKKWKSGPEGYLEEKHSRQRGQWSQILAWSVLFYRKIKETSLARTELARKSSRRCQKQPGVGSYRTPRNPVRTVEFIPSEERHYGAVFLSDVGTAGIWARTLCWGYPMHCMLCNSPGFYPLNTRTAPHSALVTTTKTGLQNCP